MVRLLGGGKFIVFRHTERGRLPKLSKEELNDIVEKFYDALKGCPKVKFNGTFVDESGRRIRD